MTKKQIFGLFLATFCAMTAFAQEDDKPKVSPKAYYINADNEWQETTSIDDGEAPLEVTFRANPTNMGEHTPSYEWHFHKQGQEEDKGDFLVRYEEETTYRFVESGTFDVTLICRLSDTGELVDSASVVVAISESRLEFPNAFSPNDDKINDRYGAKGVNDPQSPSHWKSIVEFHAYIFNRWGQKLYEWTDPAGSWDGTFNGHPVKEGVYYVLVKAKGADGRVYNIRKDVNLLRGYHETGNSTNTQ
jgi:gliding motility-associated-like protein